MTSIVRRSHTAHLRGRGRALVRHSHHADWLYQAYGKMPSASLLAAACCHDLSKVATGDIPANAKWKEPAAEDGGAQHLQPHEQKRNLRFQTSSREASKSGLDSPASYNAGSTSGVDRSTYCGANLHGRVAAGGRRRRRHRHAFDITNPALYCDESARAISIDAFER